jgi:hypothetical protein
MNGYAEVQTRRAMEGTIDKLALVESMADDVAHDRTFAEFVLQTVSGARSAADEQAAAWCKYVEGLPYRRETGEVLRDPRLTVGAPIFGQPHREPAGGDCDDLVLAVLAGLKSLAIPCQAEIVCTEDGWGYHIRALVGLPPLRPTVWCVVDPVWRSEREWAMIDREPRKNALAGSSPWYRPNLAGAIEAPGSSTWKWWATALGLLVVLRKFWK